MAVDRLLLETGDLLLLETGDDLLLESSTPGGTAYTLACDAGSYTITGQDATLVYTPGATPTAYTLACEAGAYSIAGQDANLLWSGSAVPKLGGSPGWNPYEKRGETEEQKRTRRIAQGIIREAQKPAADIAKLSKKAATVSEKLRADVAYYEAEAAKYATEIEQSKQAIALVMQAKNDALATRQLEQRMIAAQLQAEAAAQQAEELDVVFLAVMLAAME